MFDTMFETLADQPAIGDAIDEDGSGFISVQEVNYFFKRMLEGWTVPEWLTLSVLSSLA